MNLKLLPAVFLMVIFSNVGNAGGMETYVTFCSACHTPGMVGAPRLGDKVAWASRIASGVDTLVASASVGKGFMPPKGNCSSCSEADLKAAIEYIISQLK